MKRDNTEGSYRRTFLQTASTAQLVLTLYDVLLKNLEKFGDSIRSLNYERQTAAIKHALLVLQQLEGWLDMENGGSLAESLSQFYSMLRSMLLSAQVSQRIEVIAHLENLVLQVRGAFEEKDSQDCVAFTGIERVSQETSREHPGRAWSG